ARIAKQQTWLGTYFCSAFGVRPMRRRCAIRTTQYWQRASLREETTTKVLPQRPTVSCCSGTGAKCHPYDRYLRNRNRASATLCNRALPPSVLMDNGCSLSLRFSLRLQTRKLLGKRYRSWDRQE